MGVKEGCFDYVTSPVMLSYSQREPEIGPCALTVHRIMLVGTLLATKLYDDKRYSNQFWARVGGQLADGR